MKEPSYTGRSAVLALFWVILGPLASVCCALHRPGSLENDEEEVFQSMNTPDHLLSSHSPFNPKDPYRSLQLTSKDNQVLATMDNILPPAESEPSQAKDQISTHYLSDVKDSFKSLDEQRVLQEAPLTWTPVNPPSPQPAQGSGGKPTDDRFHPLFTPAGWDFFQNFDSESIIVNQSPTTAQPNVQSPILKKPSMAPTDHMDDSQMNSTDTTIGNKTGPVPCDAAISSDEHSPCSNATMTPVETAKTLGSPTTTPTTTQTFDKLFINAGGDAIRDIFANEWLADTFFVGGVAFNDTTTAIEGTRNDGLYQSQRVGTFDYEIPVPEGNYELILHFTDLHENATEGESVFDVHVEKRSIFPMVDIVALIGSPRKALTLETAIIIVDGNLSLSFRIVKGSPTLSAIEIDLVGDHLAHAVAGGPYEAVDIDSDGVASIHVDGSLSHTHGVGLELISWQWFEQGALVGIGEMTTLSLPVGEHDIVLKVLDNGGNQHSEAITITVRPSGHPVISSLAPNYGHIAGGSLTILDGFGFHYPPEETTVRFGARNISSSDFQIANSSHIQISNVPSSKLGVPIPVSVVTPVGESNKVLYTYIDRVPIDWRGKVSH